MADTKRASTERIATPRIGGAQTSDTLKTLSNTIGARIKLTTTTTSSPSSQILEGTLFTACPILNVVALNTSPSTTEPGDYRVVPISRIQSVQVLSLAGTNREGAGFATAQPAIGKVDTARLEERERVRVAKLKKEESKKGKGVTAEAQALFNALDRMYGVRWHGADIIVDDAVIVAAPYTVESCKAPKEKVGALMQIRKVVEGEKRKFADRSRGTSPIPRKGG